MGNNLFKAAINFGLMFLIAIGAFLFFSLIFLSASFLFFHKTISATEIISIISREIIAAVAAALIMYKYNEFIKQSKSVYGGDSHELFLMLKDTVLALNWKIAFENDSKISCRRIWSISILASELLIETEKDHVEITGSRKSINEIIKYVNMKGSNLDVLPKM